MDYEQLDHIDRYELRNILERGQVLEEDLTLLYNVCETVFRRFFSKRQALKEDFIQEGVEGIIKLVEKRYYDPGKDPLNFVYTAARNHMQNFWSSTVTMTGYYGGTSEVEPVGLRPRLAQQERWVGDFAEAKNSQETVDNISLFVQKKIEDYGLDPSLAYYVRSYFYDKLGLKYKLERVKVFTVDIVEKYRYYVNIIEFELFKKYLGGKILENKTEDLIAILESRGEVDFQMKMFLDSLTSQQRTQFLYVFSGNGFRLPRKETVLKVDQYLSIYKRVMFGGMSVEDAAKQFGKAVSSIENIIDRYDQIFS